MIRFIFVAGFLILFLIVSIPIFFIEWVIGKFRMDWKNKSSLAIVQFAFRVIIWMTGAKVTVIGEDRVPKEEAVLYVANHQSYFDILLTYVRCKRPTGYVAKKEIEKVPLLSTWMKYLHCLFLDRKNLKEGLKTIMLGIEKIKSGISICIFPEGTRNKGDGSIIAPFKEGSLKMAEKTNCPIVPIAICNTAEIFENHLPKMKPCHVIIEYGKPFYPKSLSKEDQKFLGAYTHNQIQEMVNKNIKKI